ncbi:MAG TPA: type II and III secretion system protein [Bacteroidota bacterium]|jgi:type IV pilus assembly protein PilQ
MKKAFILVSFLLSLLFVQIALPQSRDTRIKTKGYVNPQEIVSLDSTMRMDQALLVIGELSKQYAGKIIIDPGKHKNPIGVYIVNEHWRDALDKICRFNHLQVVEESEYIQILPEGATTVAESQQRPGQPLTEPPPTLQSRDIRISAVFFTTSLSKLQDYGISWNFFRSKPKEPALTGYIASGINKGDTTSHVPPAQAAGGAAGAGGAGGSGPSLDKFIGVIQSPPSFTFANIDALVKFFGQNSLGEVITSPEVVVRDGKKGRIQVGKDIYIQTRDVAGNTVNQQISTGTIIDVTPTLYTQSDTDFIYLDLTIEQSDVAPGPEINKTNVNTRTLLYDGEETVIGGLFNTTDVETREGIPFLKDLPWWFLGLRYVFGSESKVKTKNELIVLLKAELLQPLRGRISAHKTEQELLRDKKKEYDREIDKK